MTPVRQLRFALLGNPVGHSLSPVIYAEAFRVLGVDAVYDTLELAPDELAAALRSLARTGGGNVTLPYKRRVASLVGEPTPALRATHACNCFWLSERGELAGDNTDVGGFLAAVDGWAAGVTLEGASVLLLGAGGGARAALVACLGRRAKAVDLYNRTRERAAHMVESIAPGDPRVRIVSEPGRDVEYSLVVNATRLGLAPTDPLPIDLRAVSTRAVFDLVYGPGGTAWTRSAAPIGIPALDGLEMLVQQAALSLRCWFPEVEPPVEAMRHAATASLTDLQGDEACP